MKKTTYACNVCETDEHDMECEFYGLLFTDYNGIKFIDNIDSADAHICELCLIAIEKLRTSTR